MTRPLARLGGFAALAAVLAATALPASAQRMTTQRVRFTRGASTATLRSAARPGRPVRYLIGVDAGQTLDASITDTNGSDCYVQVFAPGRAVRDSNAAPDASGERGETGQWSGQTSRAGDYQILLTNHERSGTCSLDVAVY